MILVYFQIIFKGFIMLIYKKLLFFFGALTISFLSCIPSYCAEGVPLDLEGDGNSKQVKLPFKYYEHRDNDQLTLIHQGGYKVYNIGSCVNDVAVIGPLRPCIGIAVTDGVTLVTFHKHSTNSLESMGKIIRENLNIENVNSFRARIYTTRDDLEWAQSNRQKMNGGKTHLESVKHIKDFLDSMGIIRANIPADILALRKNVGGKITGQLIHADHSLGRYDLSETCVSVRLNDVFDENGQIKFSSIDPYTEDVFGYKGKTITLTEYLGPQGIANIKQEHPNIDLDNQPLINYDDIPTMYFQQSGGQKDGYTMQRGICERRMKQEEKELYFNNYGMTEQEVIDKNQYNSLFFFKL